MSRILCHLLWIGGWGLAAYGVLMFAFLPVDLGHGLCGPWGCAPPLQALAAMHAFWVVALVPPTAWALKLLSDRNLRLVGSAVLGMGLTGLGIVVARELLVWLPSVPAEVQRYFPQRLLFVLATLSDLPLIQVTLAGAVCWSVGGRRLVPEHSQLPRSGDLSPGALPGERISLEANSCPDLRGARQP